MSGFKVDLAALLEASEGVNGAIKNLQNQKASDIGAHKADYGDDDLAGTVSDFCARWEIGVVNLTKDADQYSTRLAASVVTYAEAEKKTISALSGVYQGNGVDPAAKQW